MTEDIFFGQHLRGQKLDIKIEKNMNKLESGVISLLMGLLCFLIGFFLWRKPNWYGGLVHKYSMIIAGIIVTINGIISIFKFFFR